MHRTCGTASSGCRARGSLASGQLPVHPATGRAHPGDQALDAAHPLGVGLRVLPQVKSARRGDHRHQGDVLVLTQLGDVLAKVGLRCGDQPVHLLAVDLPHMHLVDKQQELILLRYQWIQGKAGDQRLPNLGQALPKVLKVINHPAASCRV